MTARDDLDNWLDATDWCESDDHSWADAAHYRSGVPVDPDYDPDQFSSGEVWVLGAFVVVIAVADRLRAVWQALTGPLYEPKHRRP